MLEDFPTVLRLGAIGSIAPGLGHAWRLQMRPSANGWQVPGKMVEAVESVVARGVAAGQIADTVDPDELAHLFATGVRGHSTRDPDVGSE